jgi:hypothetical protein
MIFIKKRYFFTGFAFLWLFFTSMPDLKAADSKQISPPKSQNLPANSQIGDKKNIKAAYGSIETGVIIQGGFGFYPDDENKKKDSFFISNAQLILNGFILNENLTYTLSGDAASGALPLGRINGPGGYMYSDSPNPVPILLDAFLKFNIKPINTSIRFGRFKPEWGLIMTERVTRIGAISYPLYIHGGDNALGMFRTIGFDFNIKLTSWIEIEGGLFNGGKNSWADVNSQKDIIAGLLFKPLPGLKIRLSNLFSFPLVQVKAENPDDPPYEFQETQFLPNIEARYQDYGFDLILGGALRITQRDDDDSRENEISMGLTGHLGYFLIGDWFQVIARLDVFDPSNKIKGNTQIRITAGPQFFLENIHSFIKLNYMYDRFGNSRAMCKTYLESENCSAENNQLIPLAQESGNTLLLVVGVDI